MTAQERPLDGARPDEYRILREADLRDYLARVDTQRDEFVRLAARESEASTQ